MTQISPEMAQALIKLLTTIDEGNDKHPDWIDAVCTAREALPPDTVTVLASVSPIPENA
jgi:hypothetical protein